MKKIMMILSCLFFAASFINAQEFRKASQTELEKHFFSNPDVQAMTISDSSKKRKIKIIINGGGGIVNKNVVNPELDETSGTYILKNAMGEEKLFFVTYEGTDEKTKKEVSVTMVKSLNTNQSIVWAEDGVKEYSVPPGTIIDLRHPKAELIAKPFVAKISAQNILTCFNQFKKSNEPSNCNNCINCIQNCSSKSKKWQRISCALNSCGGVCWACVTSVYNFITCVF